jgi:microcystin degradation protein MlrC
MRIAIGGWGHETNTFSTLATTYADFRFLRGQALLAEDAIWREVARQGHSLFPLFRAWAHPSGCPTRACYRQIADEFLDALERCLPVDALFLELHGAMEVEEIGDGESAFLKEIRRLVGEEVFIAATFDLHGNIAPEVVQRCNLMTAYRTAPHRDMQETRERGVRLLLRCLEEGLRPTTALVKLPLLVPGEAGVTEVPPAKDLFARLPQIDRQPGILVSSIFIGCAWTDSPYTAVSVVVSGTDEAATQREALALAGEIWQARAEFKIDVPTASMEEATRLALAAPEAPVFISDAGDNITAGGAGDSPLYLEHLVVSGVEGALVAGITDAEAVQHCFAAGEGQEVDLVLGGKLDRQFAHPLAVRARVKRLVPAHEGGKPRAVIAVGGVEAVLQSDRTPFTELRHFAQVGLDPRGYKLIVVKLGYLFPELRDFAPKAIMALTPGFGDQRMERLPFRRLRRPIYPLDAEAVWPERI